MPFPTKTTFGLDWTTEPDILTPGLLTAAQLKALFNQRDQELLDFLNSILAVLTSVTPGASGAENIATTPVVGVAGATLFAQVTDLRAQILAIVSGSIPTSSITTSMLAADIQAKLNVIYSTEREVANLKAASTIANRVDGASGTFYDLNDGLNGGSAGKIDTTKTNSTGTIPISAVTIVVPVLATTGFTVGQEVTIFDDVNLERRIITAINAGVSLSFAAMTNSYKIKAQICRSSVIQDTFNHLLKFNGWSVITTNVTGVNVVAAAYDTSGNNGDKLVTANGNWITIEVNGTTIQVQKSVDGTTWTALCSITGAQVGAAIAWNGGNSVTILWNTTTIVYSNTFDVTTVTNTDQNANKVIVDNGCTSIVNNVSIKTGPDGMPQASWSGIHPTYPNSKDIRYSKATTTAVTAWVTPTQVTNQSITGSDYTNPCIVVNSANNPIIVDQYLNGTTYFIIVYRWNGSAFTAVTIYNGTTYAQQNPCARVAPSGRIWCVWQGFDATDTSFFNIHIKYTDDGGATWVNGNGATDKLTSGNTYNQTLPVVSIDKNNNVYVIWNGQDVVAPSFYNIFRNIWTGSAFQGITKLTTNTTANAQNPASIDNNTLDFNLLTPPMIYKDLQATAVKFSGTVGTTTPVLVEDVRYNINPPASVSSAVAWVDHDADANYSIAGAVSFQAGGGNESFANMTKTTAAIDGTHNEDQFKLEGGVSSAKATLRLTLTRNSTALVKNISSVMGAVGA